MAEKPRPFRVFTQKGIFLAYSQVALGEWLFGRSVDPEKLIDPLVDPYLRVELPGGAVAPVSFLSECIWAYCNQSRRRAWENSYCPIRRYRSYRWHNLSTRLRHMRTMQEKRLHSMVLADDGEPPVRAARRPARLPDLYDDYWRHNEKNWKRHRRNQWKARDW